YTKVHNLSRACKNTSHSSFIWNTMRGGHGWVDARRRHSSRPPGDETPTRKQERNPMSRHISIRKNTYLDSVSLMSMSTKANAVEGVTQALLGMATPMNKEVLANVGVDDPAVDDARPSDLMIVIDASDDTIEAAIEAVNDILARKDKGAAAAHEVRYRTLDGAFSEAPDTNLVLISVNGAFAAREARKALNAGKSVMIFSDNVPVE